MKTLSILILILLTIIDVVISIIYFNSPLNFNILVIIHLALYIVLLILKKVFLKKYEGVAHYIALCLPGLGWIIVCITYFSLHYFVRDSMVLSDYERYILYESDHNKYEKVDYSKEIKTLTFLDQMNIFNPDDKKQLIIESSTNDYESKIKLLKKGLSDIDNEVQHYSAVTLNMIENEYANSINQLREIYNLNNDIDALIEMEKVYNEYINSGLLQDELLNVFNIEYIEVLNKIMGIKSGDFDYLNKLVQAYIRGGNYTKALDINIQLTEAYNEKIEPLINHINILYKQKEFNKLKSLVNSLEDKENVMLEIAATSESDRYLMNYKFNINEMPKEYKDKLSYWLGKRI